MKASKWTKKRTANLIDRVKTEQNKSSVFTAVAKEMGLRPNSVRNFYYKVAHKDDKKVFESFSKTEINELLSSVILGTARGESVRGICMRLAGGDKNKMLRLQNKYRSVLSKNPEKLEQIAGRLEKSGYITKPAASARIIKMPIEQGGEPLSDTDITNLFMGLVKLVRKNSESQIEKLKKEIARLKENEKIRIN